MERKSGLPLLLGILGIACMFALTVYLVRMTRAEPQRWGFPSEWYEHTSALEIQDHEQIVGKPMPPLAVANWVNGEVDPQALKGKVVVLDFWATWCAPCLEAIPHNNKVAAKYRDKGVQFIGVCTSHGQENIETVLKANKIGYPIALDSTLEVGKAWHILWFPTYAVVDRKGTLRAIGVSPNYLEKVIDALVAEPG